MRLIQILILIGLSNLFISGCALLPNAQEVKEKKEILAKKTRNFEELRRAIRTGALQPGMTSAEVRTLYGEPDDIYVSSSSVSRLEIWTYEPLLVPANDPSWQPVRLYLDNDKLITWKY